MALKSELLSPSARLQQAAKGPPSVRPLPSIEDPDAVKRIQQALQKLGFLGADFGTNLLSGDPFGVFGPSTVEAVVAFQKSAFPGQKSQWDGIVGKGTLAKLDARLPAPAPAPPGPGPKPAPTGDSITQVLPSTAPVQHPDDVVDPLSVAQIDPVSRKLVPLRVRHVDSPIRKLLFDVRRDGKKYWIAVVAPAGVTSVRRAHLFLHPAPGQRPGLHDSDYPAFAGLWPDVARYARWLGTQLAAAGRDEVLIVPLMTSSYFGNLGFFGVDTIDRINELLAAVHEVLNGPGMAAPTLTALGLSSFSVGISALAKMLLLAGPSGLVREVFDFDGQFSNAPEKHIAAFPGAIFLRYSQAVGSANAPPNFFFAPTPRWKLFKPPPTDAFKTHGRMPDLFLHAVSA